MRVISKTDNELVIGQSGFDNVLIGGLLVVIGVFLFISLSAFIIGIPFFVIGVLFCVRSRSWKITAFNITKTLKLTLSGINFKNTTFINFDEIANFEIEQFMFETTKVTGPRSPQDLNFIINKIDNEKILLNAGMASNTYVLGVQLQRDFSGSLGKIYETVKKLADFTGKPLIDKRAENIKAGMSEFKSRELELR